MNPIRRPAILAIAAIAALGIAACTPADTQSQAEGALCDSVTAFGDSLADLEALDPATATVDDIEAARDATQEAWDDVLAAGEDVAEADQTAVEDAWDGVVQAVDDIDTDAPIADALDPVQAAAADVRTAYQEMSNGLGCS